MAIAFDAATLSSNVTTATNTFSHTITGTNPILFVTVYSSSPGTITGVTWGGVALTFLNGITQGGNGRSEIWYLAAPATGTANVVISQSGSVNIGGVAASYTGVAQSNPIDVSNTNSGSGTATSVSLATVVNNCWLLGTCWTNRVNSNGTNGTIRASSTSQFSHYDSNGAITPAGSTTTGVNLGSSSTWAANACAFKPFVTSTVTTGNYAENLAGSGTSASVTLDATTFSGRFVYAMVRADADLTTATYGGVSMTKVASGSVGGSEYKAMFYLTNAPSGSNTLTVNSGSSTGYLRIAAQSLVGVGSVDNTNSSIGVTTGTSANISVTTTTVDAWVVGGAGDNGAGAISASTGTAQIGTGENALRLFQRNDNPQGSTGSKTMNFSSSSGGSSWGMFAIAVAPGSAASSNSNFLMFM